MKVWGFEGWSLLRQKKGFKKVYSWCYKIFRLKVLRSVCYNRDPVLQKEAEIAHESMDIVYVV